MEKDYVCRCNNCWKLLIDKNPDADAEMVELTGEELEMGLYEFQGEKYWGCPICESDYFLTDKTTLD